MDQCSMVYISAIRVRLAVAVLINSVFIKNNVHANMAAGARRINIAILFTNQYQEIGQTPAYSAAPKNT